MKKRNQCQNNITFEYNCQLQIIVSTKTKRDTIDYFSFKQKLT